MQQLATKKELLKKHRKQLKTTIKKHAKKIARVVCAGKKGCEKLKCHEKVSKKVRKHLKKVRSHTKKALKKCVCEVQAHDKCGVDAKAKNNAEKNTLKYATNNVWNPQKLQRKQNVQNLQNLFARKMQNATPKLSPAAKKQSKKYTKELKE